MVYYICVPKINGRYQLMDLARKLDNAGYDEGVEYSAGGQIGDTTEYIYPHLRFLNEEDALAYILTYGGSVTKELPTYWIVGG